MRCFFVKSGLFFRSKKFFLLGMVMWVSILYAQSLEFNVNLFIKTGSIGEKHASQVNVYEPKLKVLFEPQIAVGWRFKKLVSVGYAFSYANNSYWLARNEYTFYQGPYLSFRIKISDKFSCSLKGSMDFVHWDTKKEYVYDSSPVLSMGFSFIPSFQIHFNKSFIFNINVINRFADFQYVIAPHYTFTHTFIYELGGGIGFTYLLNFSPKLNSP